MTRTQVGLSLLCWLALAGMLRAQDIQIAQRDVKLSLIRADGSRLEWPAEAGDATPQVTSARLTMTANDTIHSVLTSRGLRPDVEAFSIVYSLNPELESLDELPNGATVVVPMIAAGPWLKAQLAAGSRVMLTTEPKLKAAFDQNVRSMTAVGDGRLKAAAANSATLASISNVVETMEFIRLTLLRRNGRPLSAEALEQLNAEADLLRSILEPVGSSNRAFTPEDGRRIAAIEKDIEVKKARFVQSAAGGAPESWPRTKVVVRTLRNGEPVPNLRVYYVPEALAGRPDRVRPFDTLTSPASRTLPEADYLLWAAIEGEMAPVSNQHRLEVRKGRDIEVDLTVLR